MRDVIAKLAIGTAGGALIEGSEQVAQMAAPAFEAVDGSSDPLAILKIISQIAIALATIISLFVKKKDQPQQPAPTAPAPQQPTGSPAQSCARGMCVFPDLCTNGQCAQRLADQVSERYHNRPR